MIGLSLVNQNTSVRIALSENISVLFYACITEDLSEQNIQNKMCMSFYIYEYSIGQLQNLISLRNLIILLGALCNVSDKFKIKYEEQKCTSQRILVFVTSPLMYVTSPLMYVTSPLIYVTSPLIYVKQVNDPLVLYGVDLLYISLTAVEST